MDERRGRQLSGVVGALLVAVAVSVLGVLGSDLLRTPVTLGQTTLLGVAGVCDLVAAVDGRRTWYRSKGAGNVLLGLALPVGFVGSGPFVLAVSGVAGISMAAIGVDLLAFDGRYIRRGQLDRR